MFQVFFSREGATVFEWGFLEIHTGGLRLGFFLALRILLLVGAAGVLTATTAPVALADGIEDLLSPLKRVRFPAHEVAMMMTIALRFIPTLGEEAEKIKGAQAARGADFSEGGPLRRARSLVPVLVPLTVGAFRRADELAEAMESRGYKGGEGRTRYRELRFRARDALALCRHRARTPDRGPALTKYAGLVEYDGADFAGWAAQPGLRTVEGVLSEALYTVLRQPVKMSVAGRTDAGVHASGQVISFSAETDLRPAQISYKATAVLPKDVAMRRCVAAREDFDARRDAISRTYEYRLVNHEIRSPLKRHRAAYVPQRLDLDLLSAAARIGGRHPRLYSVYPDQGLPRPLRADRHPLAVDWARRSAEVPHNRRLVSVRHGTHPGRYNARGRRRQEGPGAVLAAALGRKPQRGRARRDEPRAHARRRGLR